MRRKTPKSHIYTIAVLSLITLSVAGYIGLAVYEPASSDQPQPVQAANEDSTIEVGTASEMSQLEPEANQNVIQSQGEQVQSATGASIYSQYDSQTQGTYRPQATQ